MRSLLTLCSLLLVSLPAWTQTVPLNGTEGDAQVRYVAAAGNDGNDGRSLATPKHSIAAAVATLPTAGEMGNGGFHYGVVQIGAGLFVEAGDLELNSSIAYNCAATGLLDDSGTTIKLADNANRPLFTYTSSWETSQPPLVAGSHYVSMRNCSLDGNAGSNTAGAQNDLVDLVGGGYNTYFENVSFQNAGRYGLFIEQRTVNFSCYTCTFANDQHGAVYVNATSGGTIFSMYDTQLDNDGPNGIVIHTAESAANGMYTFVNLKSEGTESGTMQHVIRHDPPPANNNAPPDTINIIGGWAYQSASGGGDSFAYDSQAQGVEAHWNIIGSVVQAGYHNHIYHSANSGYITAASGVATQVISVDRRSAMQNLVGPDIELSGGASVSGGGNPQGVVTAQPGSLFLDHADGQLWFKQSGTGNSGWVVLAGPGTKSSQ